MNVKVEVTWRTLQTIAYPIMVHARVYDKYIFFAIIHTTDHIFPALPIKHLVNQYVEPATPQKLATGTKPVVSNLFVLFCLCVLRKATAHVDTKALNMCHQSPEGFRIIFVGIPRHKKGTSSTYLVHKKQFFHMTLYLTKYFLVR